MFVKTPTLKLNNHYFVYNTFNYRSSFAITEVVQDQLILHALCHLGVVRNKQVNFDIMVGELSGTAHPLGTLKVWPTQDNHIWELVAIFRVQSIKYGIFLSQK